MQFFVTLLLLSICRIFSVTLMATSLADIRLASLLASVVQRPFCFWVRGPELRLCELGHWVPQFIFFSGLAIPPGAAGRSTPLEDGPSSSTPFLALQSSSRFHFIRRGAQRARPCLTSPSSLAPPSPVELAFTGVYFRTEKFQLQVFEAAG